MRTVAVAAAAAAAAIAIVLATGNSGASTLAQLKRLGLPLEHEQRFEDFSIRPSGAKGWCCALVEAEWFSSKTVWRCPANTVTAIAINAEAIAVSTRTTAIWVSVVSTRIAESLKSIFRRITTKAAEICVNIQVSVASTTIVPELKILFRRITTKAAEICDIARAAAVTTQWKELRETSLAGSAAAALTVVAIIIFACTWRCVRGYRSQELVTKNRSEAWKTPQVASSPLRPSPIGVPPPPSSSRRSASPPPRRVREEVAPMSANATFDQQVTVQSVQSSSPIPAARRRSETPPPQVNASPKAPQEVPANPGALPDEACLLEIVNNGTVDQVRGLKGFGAKRAAAVLKYRTEHGPFLNIAEIESAGVSSAVIKKCMSSGA
jgi:hypothetical protein